MKLKKTYLILTASLFLFTLIFGNIASAATPPTLVISGQAQEACLRSGSRAMVTGPIGISTASKNTAFDQSQSLSTQSVNGLQSFITGINTTTYAETICPETPCQPPTCPQDPAASSMAQVGSRQMQIAKKGLLGQGQQLSVKSQDKSCIETPATGLASSTMNLQGANYQEVTSPMGSSIQAQNLTINSSTYTETTSGSSAQAQNMAEVSSKQMSGAMKMPGN
jgi:hypothetical protein